MSNEIVNNKLKDYKQHMFVKIRDLDVAQESDGSFNIILRIFVLRNCAYHCSMQALQSHSNNSAMQEKHAIRMLAHLRNHTMV